MATDWSELPRLDELASTLGFAHRWGSFGAILAVWMSQPRSLSTLHIDISLPTQGAHGLACWTLPLSPMPSDQKPAFAMEAARHVARAAAPHLSMATEAALHEFQCRPVVFRETLPLGPFDILLNIRSSPLRDGGFRLTIRRLTRIDEPRALAFYESQALETHTPELHPHPSDRRLSL